MKHQRQTQINYIQAPYTPVPITIHKGKKLKIKKAKWHEVPPDYRKKRFINIQVDMQEVAIWYAAITELFRKGNRK